MKQEQQDQLETLIDETSLSVVLETLVTICREKADHIRSNWQDHVTARTWDDAANTIELTTDALTE